jgi:hypothetical protein
MPPAGAYVVVDGQTYRVLDRLLDDVTAAIRSAMEKGTALELNVVAEHAREGVGAGTLHLQGKHLASVAVLAGPIPQKGHPTTY